MKKGKHIWFWLVVSFIFMPALTAHATTVSYILENVILADSTQMTGEFSWTFSGDFENGTGQWAFLDIPWTLHNHTDLNTNFELDSSIEITLEGSVHDDGVDISLFLLQPLTPNTSSSIDLVRSKYEIGGNGFHDGSFLSGAIVPILSGDMDGDEMHTSADIPLFIQALADSAAYDAAFPTLDADLRGDINQDGQFNLADVSGFKGLFAPTANATEIPEPTTMAILCLCLIIVVGARGQLVANRQ